MGICGTAMGNAALLLKEQGHEVCGADSGVYPPMCDVLADAGIEVYDGYDETRLAELAPDRVVVGNAMSRGNVEVEWLLNQHDVSYLSLPQLFHDTILSDRLPVVITGTHGKTTTSTLTAYLLQATGAKPGWLIGGVPRDLSSGAALGQGAPFVIEGDEYDSAFFDKRSKFIHYRPQIAVLNNLEFDHADIFRDLEDVKRTFRHFLRIIPSNGYILYNGDDSNLSELLPVSWARAISVGTGECNDLRIENFVDTAKGSSFDLIWRGELWAHVDWLMHGLFNARNAAMAALATAFAVGYECPKQLPLLALSQFSGVKRRQDVLHSCQTSVVIEDFAHHPTAISGALEALRAAYSEHILCACFEPRSNTACTAFFQSAFTTALSHADRVYLGAVHRADKLADENRLDTAKIASDLSSGGVQSLAFETNEALYARLEQDILVAEKVLYLFFTNGAFAGLPKRMAELADSKRCVAPE